VNLWLITGILVVGLCGVLFRRQVLELVRAWLFQKCTSKFFTGDVAVIVHYLAWGLAISTPLAHSLQ